MLIALLLLVAAAQPVETETVDPVEPSTPPTPDWFLYALAIATVAATIHFFRSLTKTPPHQQFKPPQPLAARQPPSLPSSSNSSSSSTSSTMSADENKAWTLAELKEFDGSDATKPLLMGCGGRVFDVSSGRGFYGPGAAYGVFAGKDASRGLARMEIEYNGADISDLSGSQQVTLDEWAQKFESKYPVVGRIVDSSEPNSGSASPSQPAGQAAASANTTS